MSGQEYFTIVFAFSFIALPNLLPKKIGDAPAKLALLDCRNPMAKQAALLGWVCQKVGQLQAGNIFRLRLQLDFPAAQSCLINLGAVNWVFHQAERTVLDWDNKWFLIRSSGGCR